MVAGLWLRRGRIAASFRPHLAWAIVGGLLSALGYGIVIWAMGKAPLAHVSALRETSVILAAIIGTVLLGEPFGRRRILAAVLVAAGNGLLHLAG
jgi:drug/metabolite transporter (DMT)-like permease